MPINPLAGGPDDQNDLNQANRNQISTGTNVNVTGSNPGTGAALRPPQAGSNTTQPTGFTNLNQYVQANQDQGLGVGQKIAENVRGQANQGLQGLSQASQEFNKDIEGEGVKASDYGEQNVFGKVANALYGNNASTPADALASDFGKVRSEASAFASGSDTGPKTLSDVASYTPAAAQLTNAEQAAQSTGTEAGRQTILQQEYKKPGYSVGQQNFDQLLSQNTPGGRQTLNDLRNNLLGSTGLASQENQAIQNAANERNQVSQQTQQAATNINNILTGSAPTTGATPGVQYGILTNYQQALQNLPTQLNQLQQTNLQNNITNVSNWIKQTYGNSLFGKTADQWAQEIVSGANPVGSANLGNSLTQTQYNQLGILNQLAGNTGANQYSLGNGTLATAPQSNPATAGATDLIFNPNAQLGYTQANQDLSTAVNAYKSDVQNTANQILNQNASAYGQTMPMNQLVNYVVGRVNGNMEGPAYDAQQNNQVGDILQSELGSINNIRTSMGLPAVDVSQDAINSYKESKAREILSSYGDIDWSSVPSAYNALPPGFSQAVDAAARTLAYRDLVNSYAQNPLTNVGDIYQSLPTNGVSAINAINSTVTPISGVQVDQQGRAVDAQAQLQALQNLASGGSATSQQQTPIFNPATGTYYYPS